MRHHISIVITSVPLVETVNILLKESQTLLGIHRVRSRLPHAEFRTMLVRTYIKNRTCGNCDPFVDLLSTMVILYHMHKSIASLY